MSHEHAATVACPVCGAAQRIPTEQQGYACRRCRADLQGLLQTRRAVALETIEAFAATARGDRTTASVRTARLDLLNPLAAHLLRTSEV